MRDVNARRPMDVESEATKIGSFRVARFGEPAERPAAQLARIVQLMGAAWLEKVAERAEQEIAHGGPLTKRRSGEPRTRGGVLFAVARAAAWELMVAGTIKRCDFYHSFCWREPQPPMPKSPPEKRPLRAATLRPTRAAVAP